MIRSSTRAIFSTLPSVENHDYGCYRSVTDFIKRLVDHAVLNALNIIENMHDIHSDIPPHRRICYRIGYFGNEWPTCGNVNKQNLLMCVQTEMKSWNALPALKDWMFYVDFIGLTCNYKTDTYTYQVLWSIPTAPYPEPQVTVSVFFYIAASIVHPAHYPVDVRYVFEGHQFAHNLHMIFRPKWLYDILDMKTMMFKTFDF